MPTILFAEELVSVYPEAEVILTNRDPEKWWKSYSESISAMRRRTGIKLAEWLDPEHLGRVVLFSRLCNSVFFAM
jgi:hypothetical protein